MSKILIEQIPVGRMMNFSYLIGDEGTRIAAVVDPSWDVAKILMVAEGYNLNIEKILLTHTHYDHMNAMEKLVEATGAKVYVHGEESGTISPGLDCETTSDGMVIDFGDSKIECMHTPGHTPGSQCFLIDGNLFTGDTLFVDGCGRVDLPGGDPRAMMSSLKRLGKLSTSTVVYPGHDYGRSRKSTIGEQMRDNPYMSAASPDELL